MTEPIAGFPGQSDETGQDLTWKQSCGGCLLIVVLLAVGLRLFGALTGAGDDSPDAAPTLSPTVSETLSPTPSETEEDEGPREEATEEFDTPSPTETTESPTPSPTESSDSPTPTPSASPTPTPEPEPEPVPDGETSTVTRIVDGDTVELANGETVRVLGIDTPERGECHFETASQRMSELVLNQSVDLVRDGDNRGSWGRLLRYIDVNGVDAGLTLIQEGLAISRYDSRDGYGFHTREPQYIAADNATAMQTCAPVPPPEPAPEPEPAPQPPANDCDPNYTPCVPVYPPDINCGDISFPVQVIGSDPHGFDADGDGRGCDANG